MSIVVWGQRLLFQQHFVSFMQFSLRESWYTSGKAILKWELYESPSALRTTKKERVAYKYGIE